MSPSYFLYATQRDVSRLLNTFPELEVRIDEMSNYAKHGSLFDAVKQLVIETKTPSISLTQRTFESIKSDQRLCLKYWKVTW